MSPVASTPTRIGAIVAFIGMVGAWAMPVHQVPWTAFHAEAFIGAAFVISAATSILLSPQAAPAPRIVLVVLLVALLPMLQLSLGQIKLEGIAWVSTLYLLGLALAISTGASLQRHQPGVVAQTLFVAAIFASTLSVALQLCQWFGQDATGFCGGPWVLNVGNTRRPCANMAQPNHLATLYLWGLLGHAWAWGNGKLRGSIATAGCGLLVFGLALTGSRTGGLSLFILVTSVCVWRKSLPSSKAWVVALTLLLFYVAIAFYLSGPVEQAQGLADVSDRIVDNARTDPRWAIWKMFAAAALQQPLLGYGWSQSIVAQMSLPNSVLVEYAGAFPLSAHAHNLFLDLVLWVGIPLGLTLSCLILYWVWRSIGRVKSVEGALMLLFVVVVGIHAMLEFPLHYAIFLLPVGLMVGAMEQGNEGKRFRIFRAGPPMLLCASAVLLALVVRDYFRSEESFNELRLERARIVSKVPRTPPDVLVLTQLRDNIILARLPVQAPASATQLEWIEGVALNFPTAQNMLQLSAALALSGQPEKAATWLRKACIVLGELQCTYVQDRWAQLQIKHPQLVAVPWSPNIRLHQD